MIKVKQSKARQSGTVSVASKDQKSLESRKMISAERNGQQRNFTALTWNSLPPDKEGWKETEGKPADIKINSQQTGSSDEDKAIVARYNELFGEEAEPSLEVGVMADLIKKAEADLEASKAKEGMVDFVVDQEFLDLNPDVAKQGLKAGDVIQIEKAKGGTE